MLTMEETSKSNIASLRNNYGGFKQIAFWDKFATVIFGFNVILITCGVIVGIFLICTGMSSIDGEMAVPIILTIVIGIFVGVALIFFQYILLMLIQLFLSYLYDVKQQRITIENLTLIKGGEALDNSTLETFATITEMESMNIDTSDIAK